MYKIGTEKNIFVEKLNNVVMQTIFTYDLVFSVLDEFTY